MRYSLSDYVLSVTTPENDTTGISAALGLNSNPLTIGGEGSYLENITVSIEGNVWSTKADATGSWVHTKNLARNGTVTVELSQLSEKCARFKLLCNLYYSANDYAGVVLSLTDKDGREIVSATDCMIQKIPDHTFASEAGTLSWVFTCGQIAFND